MTDPVATTPTPADPAAVKSGLFTTEHVMAYVAILLTSLYGAGVIPSTGTIGLCFTIAAIALTSAGYSVTRGMVKSNASKAGGVVLAARINNGLVLAGLTPPRAPQAGHARFGMMMFIGACATVGMIYGTLVGCAAAKQDVKTMSGAFATCAKADLGVIVPEAGVTLLSDVAKLVTGNPVTLVADLTALGMTFGVDSIKCAIASVEAVIAPPPAATGSGSAQLATATRPPGLVRALAWAASAK